MTEGIFDKTISVETRLARVADIMRELSQGHDPEKTVELYARRIHEISNYDRLLSVTRRGLETPQYKIARDIRDGVMLNLTDDQIVCDYGLISDLLYSNEAQLIEDLPAALHPNECPFLSGYQSLMAVPVYDQGEGLNMVLLLSREHTYTMEDLPIAVLMTNLFGRSMHHLTIYHEAQKAFDALEKENKVIASLQQTLVPTKLPVIPGMDIAASYQAAQHASGDYYDIIPLPYDRWGIMIADVAGHGSSASVLMAVTHCLLHTHPELAAMPAALLQYMNEQLCTQYTKDSGRFVTAFYAVWDDRNKTMLYASAGHHAPRVKRCSDGSFFTLDQAGNLPLGIMGGEQYLQGSHKLISGDQMILFTDGVTESRNGREMFGIERLDKVLEHCNASSSATIEQILENVNVFTENAPPDDDMTLVVARIL